MRKRRKRERSVEVTRIRNGLKKTVLGIRIRKIPMFLGLLDPDPLVRGTDPDPLVRGTDPDPASKDSKKKPSVLLFCDFVMM